MTLWDELSYEGRREGITLIVRLIVVTLAVIARFFGKFSRTQKNKFWWDDFWILAAWCLQTAAEATAVWGYAITDGGVSLPLLLKHGNRKAAEDSLLAGDIGSALWHAAIACVCLSVLCFYLRIFEFEDRFRYYVYVLFALSVAWGIAAVVANFLLCIPVSNFWKMIDLDKCASYNTYLLATSILEILITAAILSLPIRPVMKLNLDLRTRLTVLGIFLLGGFAVKLNNDDESNFFLADLYQLYLWSAIHITAAFLSACVPACKPVWTKMVDTSKSFLGYTKSLSLRLRSKGSFNTLRRAGGRRSSEETKKSGSSSSLRGVEVMPGKSNGDDMIEEYHQWNNRNQSSHGHSHV
ncbi:hypothetical protein CC78DRAFT_614913 [Lojkania enalia]|uniref:Rhodopsin domain-containing protein n=1 Tax=Lojkania enalia TaxID=147567 RepID=A0A9P4KCI8_9PLEO|nr:hypothetical protein CC78DRAFT_614913 [Didymosphaeria enalia]